MALALRVRELRTGLALTELGFGAAQLGNLFHETTDEASTEAVDAALSRGLHYFDTAPHYGLGLSEKRLGAALSTTPRDSYVLSSKVGRLLVDSPESADRLDDDGFVVPASTRRVWDFSRDGVLRSIEATLRRLGTDRLDIAYLHDPDEHWEAASTTAVAALIELREQGVVSGIGAGMNQSRMLTEFVRRCDIDVVMVAGRFTLLDQTAFGDLLPLAAERGVGVVAAAVYNSGLLSSETLAPSAHFDYDTAPRSVFERAVRIGEVCARHGVTLPIAAIHYPLRHSAVVSVVTGMRTAAHVYSTVQRYASSVPESLWDELDETGLAPDPARPRQAP